MKISHIFQLKDFSTMILFGFLLGMIYGILNIANIIKQRQLLQILTDMLFSVIAITLLIILINKINLGEFRLYLFTGYIIGIIIERITLGKLFAKGYKNIYNHIVNILKRLKNSRFGRFVFK